MGLRYLLENETRKIKDWVYIYEKGNDGGTLKKSIWNFLKNNKKNASDFLKDSNPDNNRNRVETDFEAGIAVF